MACARNARRMNAARNCGRPKRSRVKYEPIRSSRVFYHVGSCSGKVSPMSDSEAEVKDNFHRGTAGPSFAAGTEPSYAHTLFYGPDGLRPGWGLGFYVISFLLLQQFAVQLAWVRDLGDSGLWSKMLEEVGDFLAATIPAIVLARIER